MRVNKNVKGKRQIRGEKEQIKTIAYRLECAKTANGLSHFVMYGDVQKDKALL